MSVTMEGGFDASTLEQTNGSKGELIRAKIAANRAKRLAIADAMKREAGVTGHEVHAEDFGGLAYLGTGRISSPEGRKIIQLWTVAHECGHIFLHNSAPGYSLPSHVKEMEAESYAHQCFREHGMTLPRRHSKWGRDYVGSWIKKDRDAGIPIDPRVEAYVRGLRSPYEPLRLVPSTWKIFVAEPPSPPPQRIYFRETFVDIRGRLKRPHAILPAKDVKPTWLQELGELLALCASNLVHGSGVTLMVLFVLEIYHPMPDVFPKRSSQMTWAELGTAGLGGLIWTNLVVLWRTMTR